MQERTVLEAVSPDLISTLPHPTLCPWRWILMDLCGSLLWLQVRLGQQEKWGRNISVENLWYILPHIYLPVVSKSLRRWTTLD